MILVTGATGTVGSEVVKQLLEAGQKVRALVRGDKKLDPRVEVAHGDMEKPDARPAAAGGRSRAAPGVEDRRASAGRRGCFVLPRCTAPCFIRWALPASLAFQSQGRSRSGPSSM